LKVKVAFIWVAIIVFLLFLVIGGRRWPNDVRGITCFREYSEVMRFIDDAGKRGQTTCTTTRMRHCPNP
jgi:hypothetical protein